jgi:hypothetical protein
MKLFIALLMLHGICFAQQPVLVSGYEHTTKNINTLKELAAALTKDLSADRQKVTSIFRWITDNISYNVGNTGRNAKSNAVYINDDDTATVLRPLNERVANIVLKKRMAVCDGYARLFKTLCDYAGIPSEIVNGYGRTGRRTWFRSNHSWNAVYFDSAWHLLDATWASGYVSTGSNEFVRNYSEQYFLASPSQFIADHYPEDIRWTLLKDPPALKEYHSSPFRYQAYHKFKINSFKPAKGIIEAGVGDTLLIEVETAAEESKLLLSDASYLDSNILIGTPDINNFQREGNKITYSYIVHSETVQWLHVILNEEAILRYRVNIKKSFTGQHPTMSRSDR